MGLIHVDARMTNLSGFGAGYEASFIVDTGSIHCVAPRKALVRAMIKPEGRREYELADGTMVEHEFGFAKIELLGMTTVAHVVFGEDHVEPVIGVIVLESLGLLLDPASESVILGPATMLK